MATRAWREAELLRSSRAYPAREVVSPSPRRKGHCRCVAKNNGAPGHEPCTILESRFHFSLRRARPSPSPSRDSMHLPADPHPCYYGPAPRVEAAAALPRGGCRLAASHAPQTSCRGADPVLAARNLELAVLDHPPQEALQLLVSVSVRVGLGLGLAPSSRSAWVRTRWQVRKK